MKIILLGLEISDFKGLKNYACSFDGEDKTVEAENGVGKTSLYDAFLWCLFGKNAEGRKDFGVRPLDRHNNMIKDLTVSVKALIKVDDREIELHREQVENIIKKRVTGFETVCRIDGVLKKVGDYNAFISEIVAEDRFKLLTDLDYFNGKLLHPDRRKVLFSLCGNIEKPTGFDELVSILEFRTVKEHIQVLTSERKGYEKDRVEIPTRIDELQSAMKIYSEASGEFDTAEIETKRIEIDTEILALKRKEKELLGSSNERQRSLDLIEAFQLKRLKRSTELNAGRTDLVRLSDEKYQLQSKTTGLRNKVDQEQHKLKNTKTSLNLHLKLLGRIRGEWEVLDASESVTECFACDRPLPPEKIEAITAERETKLESLVNEGNESKIEVKAAKSEIVVIESCIATYETELAEALSHSVTRGAEIDGLLENVEPIDPSGDKTWQIFDAKIKEIESKLGDSVTDLLQEYRDKIDSKTDASTDFRTILATSDRYAQDTKRIQALNEKEKGLSQKIAEVDEKLDEVYRYTMAESELIEGAVNSKFEHVKWKLFDVALNGNVNEICDASYNGVMYSDLSTGQKIYVDIDIVNVMSEHYGISVVLFIDHSESITMPIEANSQVIKLKAVDGVSQLMVK